MFALYKGLIITAVASIILIYFVTDIFIGIDKLIINKDFLLNLFLELICFFCSIVGLVVTGLIVWTTEYYTSTEFNPVRSVAKSSESGHATNIIRVWLCQCNQQLYQRL